MELYRKKDFTSLTCIHEKNKNKKKVSITQKTANVAVTVVLCQQRAKEL